MNVARIGGDGGVKCGEEAAPSDATRPPFSSTGARSDLTFAGGMQIDSSDPTTTTGGTRNMSPEDPAGTVGIPTTDPHHPSAETLETLVSPAAASPNMSPPHLSPLRHDDICPASKALDEPLSGGGREGGAATAAAVSVATAAAAAAVFAVATAGAGAGALAAATAAGAAATAAGATAAVASASRSGERDAVVVGEPVGKGGAGGKKVRQRCVYKLCCVGLRTVLGLWEDVPRDVTTMPPVASLSRVLQTRYNAFFAAPCASELLGKLCTAVFICYRPRAWTFYYAIRLPSVTACNEEYLMTCTANTIHDCCKAFPHDRGK